jgi:hypothetical protein
MRRYTDSQGCDHRNQRNAVDRHLFVRHYRLLSVAGGAIFGFLAWFVNGAELSGISVFVAILVGAAFAAGMWAVGRASGRGR